LGAVFLLAFFSSGGKLSISLFKFIAGNVRQTYFVAGSPTTHRERSEDGEGGIRPAMCRRPRAALRPMLALFVAGCKFKHHHSVMPFCGGS